MSAPIQIRRPEVAADIRALAELTGLSITDTLANAVKAQLAVEQAKANAKRRKRRKDAEKSLAQIRKLPVTGPLISDRDLYDEHGLPK